jgi:phosphoglycolate phosphatase-like HAD superfamily hydrolase
VCGDTVSDLLCGARARAAVIAGVVTSDDSAHEMAAAPHTHLLRSVAELPEVVLADG